MPSTSKRQQRFFGMLHAAKKGDIPASDLDAKAKKALNGMSDRQIRDFAATKTKGLPEKKRKPSAKGKRDAQPSDKTASIRRMILEKLARETSKVPTDPVMEYKGANPDTALKDDTATGCEIKSSNPAALNLKQYHLKPRTISDKDMAKLQKSASIKHLISGMRKQASVNKIAGILKLANTAGLMGNIINKTTRPVAEKPVRQTRKVMPRYTPTSISNKTAAIRGERLINPTLGMSTGAAAGGGLAYLVARKLTENRLARAGITGLGALIGGVGGTYLGYGTGPALRKELRKLHNR